MSLLVDTNVLLRYVVTSDPEHATVHRAIQRLDDQARRLFVTPQNLVELWSACTRPTAANGFGLPPALADQALERILGNFSLLEDDPTVFIRWRRLVATIRSRVVKSTMHVSLP